MFSRDLVPDQARYSRRAAAFLVGAVIALAIVPDAAIAESNCDLVAGVTAGEFDGELCGPDDHSDSDSGS